MQGRRAPALGGGAQKCVWYGVAKLEKIEIRAITPFRVIQVTDFGTNWKACMRLPTNT